jgi:hypothetical protein
MAKVKSQAAKFGTNDGFSWAVKLDCVDNEFFKQVFGRRMDDMKKAKAFAESAKKYWVGAKGRSTLAAVKQWAKEEKPKQFFAMWKSDSDNWKDDSVCVAYEPGDES